MEVMITRRDNVEKNGKNFCVLHYLADDGRVGTVFASPSYADKLMGGEKVHRGFDREKKQEFLYVKKG